MKTLLPLLLLSATLGAQTAKPVPTIPSKPVPSPAPSNIFSQDNIYTGSLMLTTAPSAPTAPEPCGWMGTWDDGKKACAIHFSFGMSNKYPPITCSPVATDYDGTQHMVCWYTPIPKSEETR